MLCVFWARTTAGTAMPDGPAHHMHRHMLVAAEQPTTGAEGSEAIF